MSETPMIAYVTKYALTSGIKAQPIVSGPKDGWINVKLKGMACPLSLYGKDWHDSLEAAIARAEDMRVTKIASLRKQIAKLEALSFDVVDQGGEGWQNS